MRRVVLHIDRLELHGFHEADRDAVAHSLRQTLAASLGNAETARRLASTRDVARIAAGKVIVASRANPAAVGAAAARSICRGLLP